MSLGDDTMILVCFFDGQFAIPSGPDPNDEARAPINRAIVIVPLDGAVEPFTYAVGPASALPGPHVSDAPMAG